METFRPATFATSVISTISSILCILAHYIIPKIRKNPGQLVLIQAYLQLFVDLKWLMISGFPEAYFNILPCPILGLILSSFSFLSLYYCAALALEIFIQTKDKLITFHSKRVKIYYLTSLFILIFIITFSSLTDSYGQNFLGFCYFKVHSPSTIIYFVYIFFFLSSM